MTALPAHFAPIRPVTPAVASPDFTQAAGDISRAGRAAGQVPAAATGHGFGAVLDQVASVENRANDAAVKLATGQLADPHQFTMLAAQARLTVQLTAAIRNRAINAFNDVMHMQV